MEKNLLFANTSIFHIVKVAFVLVTERSAYMEILILRENKVELNYYILFSIMLFYTFQC